jgi:ribose/xylose/arabinose/galactoside ABC-type transport system permease subunit
MSDVGAGRYAAAPLALVAVWAGFGLANPSFFSLDNALAISGQFGALAIASVGEMLVLVTGGFDISIGAVAALASVAASLAAGGIGPAGLVAAPLVGLACGAANGVLVGAAGVQPIVTTLGMMLLARGLALLASGGSQAVMLPPEIDVSALGYGDILGVPVIALAALAVTGLAWLLTTRLRIGRWFYMVGSNPVSARLVGVPVTRAIVGAYAFCGLAAGLAALIFLGRSGAGLATEGAGLELQAIAAAVIGGTALTGGCGAAPFVLLGAYFIQSLLNGLNLLGISPFVSELALGIVIIAAGLLDFAVRRLGRYLASPKKGGFHARYTG